MVELGQQQNIGGGGRDDCGAGDDLWIIAIENVAQQKAGPFAAECGAKAGDTQGFSEDRQGQQAEKDQTG